MRPFYLKINAKCNICTDSYPKITFSQSECSLMSHDLMLSVQRLRLYIRAMSMFSCSWVRDNFMIYINDIAI